MLGRQRVEWAEFSFSSFFFAAGFSIVIYPITDDKRVAYSSCLSNTIHQPFFPNMATWLS